MARTAHVSPQVAIDIQIERWQIERLIPRANNPRTHSPAQVAQLAASMREWGWTNPILVGADDDIIAGHARVMAARKLGMTEVPVIVLAHLSAAQRRALVIADNQLALNSGWDEDLLRIELALLQEADYDLNLVGFDDLELARLLEAQEAAEGLRDEDAVPELQETPISVHGDLWVLADHRVLCGDATVGANVASLMAGEAVDLVFTDPPFNVAVHGYTEKKLTIMNDDMPAEQFKQFLLATFSSYRRIVKPGASMYVCHSSSSQREFQNAMEAAGFEARCQIIWAKNTFAWGFGRYKFQHEPIFYSHVAGQKDPWYGDKSQSTLWEEKKPSANRIHPTAKPVELVERALVNSSKAGDIVADLFGGSGSTLIGCERRGRKARLMELDPKYADCIVRRWHEVMKHLGYNQFRVVGHDRGGRVGRRMAIDHPDKVTQLAVFDIVPAHYLYSHVTIDFVRAYFHWFDLLRAEPGPENDYKKRHEERAKRPMDEVTTEYERTTSTPEAIHAMAEDYRASASLDLKIDEADIKAGKKIQCPLLTLWAATGAMGKLYDVLETWKPEGVNVRGKGIGGTHQLQESAPKEVLAELLPFLRG